MSTVINILTLGLFDLARFFIALSLLVGIIYLFKR